MPLHDGLATASMLPDQPWISARLLAALMQLSHPCAPVQIVRDMLGSKEEIKLCNDYIHERATRGLRSIGVARSFNDGSSWELVGLISLLDPPREDSAETIKFAQSMGVEVKMVTGMPARPTSREFPDCGVLQPTFLLQSHPACCKAQLLVVATIILQGPTSTKAAQLPWCSGLHIA